MSERVIFMATNLLDSATLTASSAVTGFPVSNLQNPFRTKVWRTTGGTANLVINHGSAKVVNCVALINYSWTAAPATLNFEANATDAWGAPSFSQALTWAATPTVNGNLACIIKTFANQNYQYNRLNVVYAGGAWDLGRIFVGSYFQPARNYSPDWTENLVDPSMGSRTVGGQDHFDEMAKYREFNFSFLISTQAQFELFQAMVNAVGTSGDLFIAFDYSSEPDEMTVYGKFTALPAASNVGTAYKRLDFAFRESR